MIGWFQRLRCRWVMRRGLRVYARVHLIRCDLREARVFVTSVVEVRRRGQPSSQSHWQDRRAEGSYQAMLLDLAGGGFRRVFPHDLPPGDLRSVYEKLGFTYSDIGHLGGELGSFWIVSANATNGEERPRAFARLRVELREVLGL